MDTTAVVKGLVPWEDMCAAYERATGAVVDLLRDLPPDAADLPVPGLDWDVADTAAHLVTIVGRGLYDRRRGETLQGMHELNAIGIAEVDSRDLKAIADRIEADVARGSAGRAKLQGDEPFALHAGVVAEVSAALSYALWDFLVHGFDIARACGRDWPMPAEDAARTMRAGLPAVRPWVRPEVLDGPRQHLVLAFAADTDALSLEVGEGRYVVEPAPFEAAGGAVVDPVETVLAVSGRVPARDPLVARLAEWYQPI